MAADTRGVRGTRDISPTRRSRHARHLPYLRGVRGTRDISPTFFVGQSKWLVALSSPVVQAIDAVHATRVGNPRTQ